MSRYSMAHAINSNDEFVVRVMRRGDSGLEWTRLATLPMHKVGDFAALCALFEEIEDNLHKIHEDK